MMRMMENWAGLNSSFSQPSPTPADFDYGEDPAIVKYSEEGGETSVTSFAGESLTNSTNSSHTDNETYLYPFYDDEGTEYIFDRPDVRAVFLVLYTIVFCSCFFGNLMVILVVTLHWRMRSITNFCLANLAFADLCVGIFCVYQNFVQYLIKDWVFGEFMCKMYHFINSLSTTASVLILVVICIERYLAIIHPMNCKQMLTLTRLRITIVCVWILSAAISSPRFYYFKTISMPLGNNQSETWCVPNRLLYDSKLMDMLSLTLLFLIPLAIISVLYTQIGIVLWKTSSTKMPAASSSVESSSSSGGGDYHVPESNIVQTVNLTLLPVTDLQISTRPTTLHGIPSSKSPSSQPDKKRSLLSSSCFICLNGRNKSSMRQHSPDATTAQHCCPHILRDQGMSAGIRASFVHKNDLMNDAPNNGEVSANGISMGCNGVHNNPRNHNHVNSDSIETSFHNQSHFVNNASHDLPTYDGDHVVNHDKQTRAKVINSPLTTCCGSATNERKSTCLRNPLRKQSSNEKEVAFSTPPSPYFSRNCSCLDGKSSKTESIVLVKFEKDNKGNNKKRGWRRQQCTILMNSNILLSNDHNCYAKGDGAMRICPCPNVSTVNECSEDASGSAPIVSCNLCQHSPRPSDNGSIIERNVDVGESNEEETHICQKESLCPRRNFSFEHTRNISIDSGISGVPPSTARSIDGASSSCCAQNVNEVSSTGGLRGTSSSTSCLRGSTFSESYQLLKCNNRNHVHHNIAPHSPNPLTNTNLGCGNVHANSSFSTTPAPPKRLRRMRIIRSSKYGTGALLSRRRIIRMLIVVVLAFALCHLPFHARKVWQYWSPSWAPYQAGSLFSTFFTPFTFLIMYANSGINPILYAFMSKKFRMSFRDLLCCKMRHSLRTMNRNASVRSTHAVALSQTGC